MVGLRIADALLVPLQVHSPVGPAQREAHDRQHLFARWTGDGVRVVSALHSRADHVLTVDQRAVAVEDDEFQRSTPRV